MGTLGNLVRRATDYDNPRSLGSRLRKRRSAVIGELINEIHQRSGSVRILDSGGRRHYWNIFGDDYLRSRNVTIHMMNMESPEPEDDIFRSSLGNACAMPFENGSFDLVHSNSVVEHVGLWRDMKAFAKEVRRLAPSYYVQTPNFWFPVEPHYGVPLVHWLPSQMRASLLTRVGLGRFPRASDIGTALDVIQDQDLLTRRQMHVLFPDAQLRIERLAGLAKSLIAIRRGF